MENNNYQQIPQQPQYAGYPQYAAAPMYGFQGYPQQSYQQAYYNVPKAGNNQPLSPDRINELRKKKDLFDWTVSQDELDRGVCTHKDANGNTSLHLMEDGSYECDICSRRFNMYDGSSEDVRVAIKNAVDIMETIKTIYFDAPPSFIQAYCQILPLMEKMPVLWDAALQNYSKYDGSVAAAPQNQYQYNAFATLSQLTGNPYGMYPYAQPAPVYPQGQVQQPVYPQQQMMYQQPVQQQVYQQPVQNQPQYQIMNGQYVPAPPAQYAGPNMSAFQQPIQGNPLAYNPVPNQQPVQTQQAPAQQQQPAQPAEKAEVQQTKAFNV